MINQRGLCMDIFPDQDSKTVGLPPGTLVYTGDSTDAGTKISILDYNPECLDESPIDDISKCKFFKDRNTVTWLNVDGLTDTVKLGFIGEIFGIHPLTMEDILHTDQRPKVEFFDDYLFIVMKMIYRAKKRSEIVSEQVSFVIGANFVISFQENPEEDVFEGIRQRIRGNKGRIRKMGADYLAYALMDAIIDNYFIVLERQGDRIEDIEEELIKEPTPKTVNKVYRIKRELLYLRKVTWPLRETISMLQKDDTKLIRKETKLYVRDLYDHIIQLLDTIEIYREMTTSMLDLYLTTVSAKMNEIMKVLTIIATIFMPLTFVAGIYGMNFKHMPELEWYFGYPLALLLMGCISFGMLIFFRRKKWI